jgi:hypothetical protein
MQHEVQQGTLHEFKICRNGPGISHLLFADNTLVFLEVKENQVNVINNVEKI